MKMEGTWRKDPEEGFMDFSSSQIQRQFEQITHQYYQVYNRCLDELDDEELASEEARNEGYAMITDYKEINGTREFATTYRTPAYEMDIWYEFDEISQKRIYERGFIRIVSR